MDEQKASIRQEYVNTYAAYQESLWVSEINGALSCGEVEGSHSHGAHPALEDVLVAILYYVVTYVYCTPHRAQQPISSIPTSYVLQTQPSSLFLLIINNNNAKYNAHRSFL